MRARAQQIVITLETDGKIFVIKALSRHQKVAESEKGTLYSQLCFSEYHFGQRKYLIHRNLHAYGNCEHNHNAQYKTDM